MDVDRLLNEVEDDKSNLCKKISSIYGSQGFYVQKERYKNCLVRFKELYPESRDVHISRAGGRLLISGEHLDYHHGLILNTSLLQDIIVLSSLGKRAFNFNNMDSQFEPFSVFSMKNIKVIPKPKANLSWNDYCSAVIKLLYERLAELNIKLKGTNFLVDGREEFGGVPLGVGLSSSGALEVAVVLGTLGANGNSEMMSPIEISDLCVSVESALGFVSGIQDPYGSLMGGKSKDNCMQLIDCIPLKGLDGKIDVKSELIKIPDKYLTYILRVGDRKATAAKRDRHNIRVLEGEIAAFLVSNFLSVKKDRLSNIGSYISKVCNPENKGYPPFWKMTYFTDSNLKEIGLANISTSIKKFVRAMPSDSDEGQLIKLYSSLGLTKQVFDSFAKKCQAKLGEEIIFNVKGTATHVLEENARTLLSAEALKKGKMSKFFYLQKETGRSLRENYHIENQISESLVNKLSDIDGVVAARVLGPGSGANVLIWMDSNREEEAVWEIGKIAKGNLLIKVVPGKGASLLI
jgi:galactokinase